MRPPGIAQPPKLIPPIVIGVPVGIALGATVRTAPALLVDGTWFTLVGQFMATLGTVVLFSVAGLLAFIALAVVPFLALASMGAGPVLAVVGWLERRGFGPADVTPDRAESAPSVGDDRLLPVWRPTFGHFLERRSDWRDNLCILVQIAAHAIAVAIIATAMNLWQLVP